MKRRLFQTCCLLLALTSRAAEPASKHDTPIFSDDFNRAELGGAWCISTPTFVIADGVLKATQTHPHSAVGMVKVRRKDVVVECKFRFDGATVINAVFNDRDFKDGHGSHFARVSLSPSRIYLSGDEMRVSLDGKEIGSLKSSGLAHPMKSGFHFAVTGKDPLFDDLKIWAAAPTNKNHS